MDSARLKSNTFKVFLLIHFTKCLFLENPSKPWEDQNDVSKPAKSYSPPNLGGARGG